MFNGQTPDVLITPSDLMLFAKVSIQIDFLIFRFRTLKEQFASTQELSAKACQQVLMPQST